VEEVNQTVEMFFISFQTLKSVFKPCSYYVWAILETGRVETLQKDLKLFKYFLKIKCELV